MTLDKILSEFELKARKKICQWGKKNKLNSNGKQVNFSYCISRYFSLISLHFDPFFRKQDLLSCHFASQAKYLDLRIIRYLYWKTRQKY